MKDRNHYNQFNFLFAFIVFCLIFSFSNNAVQAKKLNAYLSYSTFFEPESGPYIETYLMVDGNSVNYLLNENEKYQASIQVIMLFKNGEDVVNYDKYELLGPELDDTLSVNFNFIDQQRYSLPNGSYEFEIQIWDKNNDTEPFVSLQPLVMNFPEKEVIISGIQLVESYSETDNPGILTKNNYDLLPYIINYFPEQVNKLTFYAEIYNTHVVLGEGEKYLVSYYLEQLESGNALDNYITYKKKTSAKVNVVFSEFDITNLPSGNYFLVIEARDKQNNTFSSNKIFIQRSNPRVSIKLEDIASLNIENTFAYRITNLDTLKEYIRCLEPIATAQEKGFATVHLASSDIEILQKFFYMFWMQRNELEPERAWLAYLNEVDKVNYAYSTPIQKGYESDRGRVYLKYGPPNAISESYNEPSTYPYEIWHYYVLENGQRNKKFVFYTKDIATNDFALLHSDVTGELSNYRWQYYLYQRVDAGFDIDRGVLPDTWGGNSKKYFDLPR
ncbi:MAG: GWxTD domain-containing protein [Bacteroidales bacterium]|nr:GWxTD domain-containing protein [Bacteroidales bacterium]